MKVSTELRINLLPGLEAKMVSLAKGVCLAGARATVDSARVGFRRGCESLPKALSSSFSDLDDSIRVDEHPDVGGIAADAVSEAEIGAFLEFGTSKSAPRPFMGPAAEIGAEAALRRAKSES